MSDHWEVLGLEPTGDVLAIKKAYAVLLKKNRPDDAPAAYQALRQAYDWALAEAAWQGRGSGEDERAQNDAALDTVPDAHAASPPDLPAETGKRVILEDRDAAIDLDCEDAQALLERWAGRLAQCEASDAEACWEALQRDLDALPLDQQGDASALFADFVLETREALPAALLVNVARYFRWGRDYRDAERLGAWRLAQLRDRLNQDAPTLFRDARQVEEARELLRLDWVLQHQGKSFGWLYAALAGPQLQQRVLDTDDRQRRALEISFLRWEAMGTALKRAGVIRLAFVLAFAIPLGYLIAQPEQALLEWMPLPLFFAGVYWFIARAFGGSMIVAGDELSNALSRLPVFSTWQNRVVAAVAIPILVALIARDAVALPALQSVFPDKFLVAAAILLCVAALLIPPESVEERQIALPMLVALGFGLSGLAGDAGAAWAVAMGAGAAWIGLGGWLYHRYHDRVIGYYRNPLGRLKPSVWWGWLLLVAAFKFLLPVLLLVLTLALPVTLRVLARYVSANTVWLAIGLAVAFNVLADSDGAAHKTLYVLALTAAVLTGLQALAERTSRRLFRRVPESFFPHD